MPNIFRSLAAVLLVFGLAVGAIFVMSNAGNERVPAGYAGYVYSKPIFGQSSFKSVLVGPSSTGFVWRQKVILTSITPYTYSEEFERGGSILAKDKLSLTSKAHIVWKLNPERVKEFMEQYGGLSNEKDADQIAKDAYDNFIKEPFRSEVRNVLSNYNALEVSSNLVDISKKVEDQLRERLSSTPFLVDSAVIGETAPPAMIVDAVEKKVAKTQEFERKLTELEIAKREIEIQKALGEAEAQKQIAEARGKAESEQAIGIGRAKAIEAIEKSLGERYIQYIGMENLRNAQKVYLPMGPNGLPIIGTLDLQKNQDKQP